MNTRELQCSAVLFWVKRVMPPLMVARSFHFLLLLSYALGVVPQPPCNTSIPNAAVPETWCSTPVASNPASGVVVAKYGFPLNSTLVTGQFDYLSYAVVWGHSV